MADQPKCVQCGYTFAEGEERRSWQGTTLCGRCFELFHGPREDRSP